MSRSSIQALDERGDHNEHSSVFRLLTVHALTWLALANLVGLWLATLLLAPRFGLALPAASYGRWLPLHLDLQFYGWISLPLIGLLFAVYLPRRAGKLPGLAVGAWSAALAFSAGSWLAGQSSGKTFLEWTGAARWVWAGALVVLAATVIRAYLQQRNDGSAGPGWQRSLKATALVAMVPVPVALIWATSAGVYPPINPDSGGATATSTLGSVLGVVAILLLAPLLMGLRPDDGGRTARRTFALLALHFLVFGVLDHGDRSHHRIDQFLGLASLVVWWPLGRAYLERFSWPAATRTWRRALGGWSALLLLSGVLATTPGVLERWKFTHVMVGHVHLALAGVCTCLCVLILQGLNLRHDGGRHGGGRHGGGRHGGGRHLAAVLGDPGTAWTWNFGLAVHVVALTWLGHLEGATPQILWSSEATAATTVTALFALRWIGGAAMVAASVAWCVRCVPVPAIDDVPLVELEPTAEASPERPRKHHATLAPDLLPLGR